MVERRPAWSWQFAPDQIRHVPEVLDLDHLTPEWAWGGSTGAGVKVAVIDSGIDNNHPAIDGHVKGYIAFSEDRDGQIQSNDAPHTDVFGHGTWVSSVALSSDSFYTGMAPDARYVNARVLDSNVGFGNDVQVRNGIGFAIDRGANVLNLSLNYNATFSSGNSPLDLMLDWAAYSRGITCFVYAQIDVSLYEFGRIQINLIPEQIDSPLASWRLDVIQEPRFSSE